MDCVVNVDLNIAVGRIFKSYKDLDEALKIACMENFVQFYKRDSRTIEAAKRRNTNKTYKASIVYADVKFACIHGGKVFKSAGNGIRMTRTFRRNCPAFIKAVATENGQKLLIQNVCNTHNHQVEKRLYQLLPHNRQLPLDVKNDVKELMRLKSNKKLIRKKLLEETNTYVTLRDISNLCRKDSKVHKNDLDAAVKRLENRGADVRILIENKSDFKGLFFRTPAMKKSMTAYPELLCIDATFLLLNIRAPVYIILVEDGNGESAVVAVAILVTEDAESLRWFLKTFKELNDSWTQVKNIMADKDWNERDILKAEFPDAKILICIFHVFRIFQRAISCQKMNISKKDRTLALTILQKIAYCRSEAEFENIKKLMESTLPQSILDYFKDNWEPIKSEWCLYIGDTFSNFLNTTNNRLESLNSALKEVIDKYSTLQDFVDGLFTHPESSQIELNVRTANMVQKIPVTLQISNDFEQRYFYYLTGYAFQKLKSQFKFSTVKFSKVQPNSYQVNSSSYGLLTTTSFNCTCIFFKSMNLPCKHIFAIRNHEGLPLFEPLLCKDRWTFNNYKLNHPLLNDLNMNEGDGNHNITNLNLSACQPRILSKQQKYNKAMIKCKLLASLAAEQCGHKYESRIEELDNLISLWKKDEQVGNIANVNIVNRSDEKEIESGEEVEVLIINVEDENNYNSQDENCDQLNNEDDVETTTDHQKVIENDISEQFSDVTDNIFLHDIKISDSFKQRGRPKGSNLTAIGISKNRVASKTLEVFESLSIFDQQKVILGWILLENINIQEVIVNGKKIEPKDIRTDVNFTITNEKINTVILKQFFSLEGWKHFEAIFEKLLISGNYSCSHCTQHLDETLYTSCDRCLEGYHLTCAGLQNIPRKKKWFCVNCKALLAH